MHPYRPVSGGSNSQLSHTELGEDSACPAFLPLINHYLRGCFGEALFLPAALYASSKDTIFLNWLYFPSTKNAGRIHDLLWKIHDSIYQRLYTAVAGTWMRYWYLGVHQNKSLQLCTLNSSSTCGNLPLARTPGLS